LEIIGHDSFAIAKILVIASVGWPMYLLVGVTGGPARGFTSHFIVPNKLFQNRLLFPVHISTFGLCAMFYILYLWA